jgi:coproporphyrinogen III oxidase-like Fe-S oxidoreductase
VTFREEDAELLMEFPLQHLQSLAEDGLVELNEEGFRVLETGRQYLRNICQAFDQKWWQAEGSIASQLFSKSV